MPRRSDVSIIIPARNAERTLRACLESVSRVEYGGGRLEVIVVVNGSKDRTLPIARESGHTVIDSGAANQFEALNEGILRCSGAVLAFTDADCEVTPQWLNVLLHKGCDLCYGGFAGEIVGIGESVWQRYATESGLLRNHDALFGSGPPFAQTCNVAFRREVFERVGMFSPHEVTGDVDLSWRIFAETEYLMRYESCAIVRHNHRSGFGAFWRQHRSHGRGWAILEEKYGLCDPTLQRNWRDAIAGAVRAGRRAGRDGRSGSLSPAVCFLLKALSALARTTGYRSRRTPFEGNSSPCWCLWRKRIVASGA